jgi:hypothetical protein
MELVQCGVYSRRKGRDGALYRRKGAVGRKCLGDGIEGQKERK